MSLSLPGLGPLDGARARRALTLLAILVLLGVGANAVRRAMKGKSSRYDENVAFSQELVYDGVNVYKTHPAQATHTKYPPFYFVYVAPFVPLPTMLGASLWFLLNALMLIGTIVMSVRLAWPSNDARGPPWTAFACLAGVMAWIGLNNISTSQVNIQIGFFVVLGLYLIRRGRDESGGFVLMIATMLKLTPALLLVWLAVRGRWKAIRGAGIGFITLWGLVTLVLGKEHAIEATRSWVDVLVPFAQDGVLGEGLAGVRHTNQSLGAAFFRFFTDVPAGAHIEGFQVNVLSLSFETAATIVKVLNAALLLAVVFVLGRGPVAPNSARFVREAALLMVLTVVISPISWMNHHIALILPYAVLLQAARTDDVRGHRALRIAVLLMLTSVWIVLMAFSLPLAGALIVGVLLARLSKKEPAPAA